MSDKEHKRFAISCIAVVVAIALVQIASPVDGGERQLKNSSYQRKPCRYDGESENNSEVERINRRLLNHEELMMEKYAMPATGFPTFKNETLQGVHCQNFSILNSQNAASFLENETNGVLRMHLNFSADTDVKVLFCIYKNISILQNRTCLDSDIYSIKLVYNKTVIRNFSRQDAVVLRLENKGVNRTNPSCLFLHPTEQKWLDDGMLCQPNSEFTECYSNHLTHIGVFNEAGPNEVFGSASALPSTDKKALGVIYYVGCVLSLTGILIMLILYCALHKDFHVFSNDRYLINLNLLIAIGMTQILFLIGIAAVQNKKFCQAVAVLLHYSTLASLAWMLVEGIVLYLKVIKVYGGEAVRIRYFFIAAWGLPMIIVTFTASIHLEGYSAQHWRCWLSMESDFAWSVYGPVAAVILINFIILILVVKTVIKSTSGQANINTNSTFASIRAVLVLFPILGLTWIFGLFALNHDSVVWKYLFIIFNGTQGFLIFIIYGIGKREVRIALEKLFCAQTLPVDTSSQLTNKLSSWIK